MSMTTGVEALNTTEFCYLTTTGRNSGKPHTIEIWFAIDGPVLYMLAGSGERADWVKNARRHPEVSVRIATVDLRGRARVVALPAEDAVARRLVVQKYQPGSGEDLSDWGRTALPVAVDLDL